MEGSTVLAWIAIFGVLTGFRSMLPMALLCFAAWRGALPLTDKWQVFGSWWMLTLFAILAVAELIADKLPRMPNRTAPPGLLTRLLLGAVAGAVLAASSTFVAPWKGALTCAPFAIFGAALGYSLRQYFREATRTRDLYIALIEDLITYAGASWVLDHLG